jgi:hypothetical protein
VYEKLPARNRMEAAAKAREQGQLAHAGPSILDAT